jgi:hypothetical protein
MLTALTRVIIYDWYFVFCPLPKGEGLECSNRGTTNSLSPWERVVMISLLISIKLGEGW